MLLIILGSGDWLSDELEKPTVRRQEITCRSGDASFHEGVTCKALPF